MSDLGNTIQMIEDAAQGINVHRGGTALAAITDYILNKKPISLSDIHRLNAGTIDYHAFMNNVLLHSTNIDQYCSGPPENLALGLLHDFGFLAEREWLDADKRALAQRVVTETIRAMNTLHKRHQFEGYGMCLLFANRYALTPDNLKEAVEFTNRSVRRALSGGVEKADSARISVQYGQIIQLMASYRRNIDDQDPATKEIDKLLSKAENNFELIVLDLLSREHFKEAAITAGTFRNGNADTNPVFNKATELFALIEKIYGHKIKGDLSRILPNETAQNWQKFFSKTLQGQITHIAPQ